MKPLSSSRRASSAAVVITLALIGLQAPTYADPLNPLDFPSLGTTTLEPGAYALNSGAPPTLSGGGLASPLAGTVSTDASSPRIAVFRFDALSVSPDAVINITGIRAVAILSSADLTLTILSDADNVSITIRGTAVANPADFNADGFVDLDDFAIFQLCFAGPLADMRPQGFSSPSAEPSFGVEPRRVSSRSSAIS